jgi:hypothetical protein
LTTVSNDYVGVEHAISTYLDAVSQEHSRQQNTTSADGGVVAYIAVRVDANIRS